MRTVKSSFYFKLMIPIVTAVIMGIALYLFLNSSPQKQTNTELIETKQSSMGIKLDNLFLGMIIGDIMELRPKTKTQVKPADLVWKVENESQPGVITVKDGNVTANKEGTAVVRVQNAFNSDDYATCPVTVAKKEKKNLAPLPPMGWNSWNTFAKDKINEDIVRKVIDSITDSGMKDAGYKYVVVDGGWRDNKLGADGSLVPNPVRFKNGIKPLADYAHSKGLKFGLHAVPGLADATNDKVGSGLKEEQHLVQFVDWGVDFVKWDWCGGYDDLNAANFENTYKRMKYFMDNSGRDILFSSNPWRYRFWTPDVTHMWRTTQDILIPRNLGKRNPEEMWSSDKGITGIADKTNETAFAAGPGSWNDPDILIVGKLNYEESKSHFSLWSIMATPLMAGNDPRMMTDQEKEILLNKEVIAVDQDILGVQGSKILAKNDLEIWTKPLVDGTAVLMLNKKSEAADISVNWDEIGYKPEQAIGIRDLWEHKDLGSFSGSFSASVPSHGVKFVKFNKKSDFKYTATIDNTEDITILYRGDWNKNANSQGTSITTSRTAGDYLEFQFYGSGIELYAAEGNNFGIADIYMDGSLVMTWDGYSDNSASRLVYKNDHMVRDQHKIKVVVKGEKNSSSAGTQFGLDYIKCTYFDPAVTN